jgi:uncharacterized protein
MTKGLEISFQVNDSRHEETIVMHLANLTGNEMRKKAELQWRIFNVTLGENRFFKVLFTGPKVNRLHPELEKEIRQYFDSLSKMSTDELNKKYGEKMKEQDFRVEHIRELKEEYDLWQDKFWQYF